MTESEEPTAPAPPWAPLLAGFRRHGVVGKVYIVIHFAAALVLLAFAVLGSPRGTGAVLFRVALAGVELLFAGGVALHSRLIVTLVFAQSILSFVGSLYAITQALAEPLALIGAVILLALSSMFVWYFGRLQRALLEASFAPDAEGTPPTDGAA